VYQDLTYEERGHVGVITLRRPEARNALTFKTYAELEDAVRTTTARCLVITGADPAFCSGDDVKVVMGGGERPPDVSSSLARTPRLTPAADALLHTDVPVVAAVNGAAVGWGMELSLMADFRVASEKARFGELFVLRGLVSDAPGLGRLAQLVGREKAAEMLMTGEVIDAPEALRIGLVGRVVPHDELLPTALGLAERIAANPPLAVQAIKRGLRRALDPDWNEVGVYVSSTLAELFQTEDHREGVASFLERREPNYVGR
jgi:enoyl-CoA hydratase